MLEEAGIPALVHALYLVNLAAPDDAIYSKSVDTMRSTVDCAIEADAVIFHPGSHPPARIDAGANVSALEQVLDHNQRTWLLVETRCWSIAIDELVAIVVKSSGADAARLIALICHLFVSGVDVTDPVVRLQQRRRSPSALIACCRCT